jgi:hypothetical protein
MVLAGVVLLGCGTGGVAGDRTPIATATRPPPAFETLPPALQLAILDKLAFSPDSSLVVLHSDDRHEIAYVPANNSFFVTLLDPEDEPVDLMPATERYLADHGVKDFSRIEVVYRHASW